MRQIIFYLCFTTALSFANKAPLLADETTPPAEQPPSSAPLEAIHCSKKELMTFFPQTVVQAILMRNHFTPEQATGIAQDLAHKDQDLVKIVEDKASKLDPNPFRDLSQRDLAIKIYRETLYEVFAKVLKSHGISDEDKIQTLLDEMQVAKSKLFVECIRRQQNTETTAPPVPVPARPVPSS